MPISFPGYVNDVANAGVLDPAWGNAVRDRALQVFASTALRDAAIPSPQAGQIAVTTDTGSFWVYMGATDGWRPPWNTPWGSIAKAVITASQLGFSAVVDATSLTTTFTAVANRQYFLRAWVPVTKHTAGGDLLVLITDGANAEKARGRITCATDGGLYLCEATLYETYTAGSITRKVRVQASTGTGDVNYTNSDSVAFISVTDVGPNGNPS